MLLFTLALTLSGCGDGAGAAAVTGTTTDLVPSPAPAVSPWAQAEVTGGVEDAESEPPAVSPPARVSVPSVGIDVDLVPLGLEPDGELEVPADFAVAGWYVDGPEPGERGPAVIVGHVDSHHGPAAFYALRHVQPGATIDVTLTDGGVVSFVVDGIEEHPKDDFPTRRVFGPTGTPALRLVTCGGEFDRHARSYRDNVVVFATPAR